MSLYQDIRPTKLDNIIGNESTVKSLNKILKSKSKPHTFLFHGERGTGKTTCARILVKELGCADIDCIELNGADNRGIDDARSVISIANTSPMGGKCRVIIWDEAHKMTNECQNALLKVLEDTSESTYFILCSTEPDKLLKTVRSRCTQYKFELLNEEDMIILIGNTLKELEKDIDDTIFFGIIDYSNGSPREALVLLEQVLTLDKSEEQISLIKKSLIEHDIIEMCRILLKGGSWKSIIQIYKGIKDIDVEVARRVILGYMKTVLLNENERDSNKQEIANNIIRIFSKNTFDSGEAGLVGLLYNAFKEQI